MSDPWFDISPAGRPDELHIRRSDTKHPLDFFYGKDFKGRYVFLYKGRLSGRDVPVVPKLAGIEITLTGTDESGFDLQLCLPDPAQSDIFRALCDNLMTATRSLDANSRSEGIVIILSRLYRWHELLKAAREGVLSRNRITGLCGELLVLRDIFLPRVDAAAAVTAWRGPYGDEQDFSFNGKMVEVKTQLSSADGKLKISSVNQLDSVSGEIFVCHLTLGSSEEGEKGAFTLNSLVDEILRNIRNTSPASTGLLTGTLIEAGYVRHSEYDSFYFIPATRDFYKVSEGFPALRPAAMPVGVIDVRYSISLEACSPFALGEETVFQSLFS